MIEIAERVLLHPLFYLMQEFIFIFRIMKNSSIKKNMNKFD